MENRQLKENKDFIYESKNNVEYIQFKNFLNHHKTISHCFTTRIGGVSSNELSSLNFGNKVNDSFENILTNYKIISDTIGVSYLNMVTASQVHDNKIKVVDKSDCGKGIITESDIIGYDGLVTNQKDVILVTFHADCVPVYFYDTINKVIGLAHSGWRGTLKEVSNKLVEEMKAHFDSNYSNIEVAIGPAIGRCCFEVGDDVYELFVEKFGENNDYYERINNKWYINTREIIKNSLVSLGVKEDKIVISQICTKCNKAKFFSHRGDEGKTGRAIAILGIVD